jgi:hypothetical protein
MSALRDVLARVVAIKLAIEDGDSAFAFALARDLERDLAALVEREEREGAPWA